MKCGGLLLCRLRASPYRFNIDGDIHFVADDDSPSIHTILPTNPKIMAIDPSCCQKSGARPRSFSYGLRSSDALPVSTSNGTELCSCVTIHLPSILRKPTVGHHILVKLQHQFEEFLLAW